MKDNLLRFGFGNAKISKSVATFSIPAGYSCPMALQCQSFANRFNGKITDGKHTQFRCFAASQEALFTNVRESRWLNFELLKRANTFEAMANLIQRSLPAGVHSVRIHVSGDFFNESYFLAWLTVALNNKNIVFYAYTKMLSFWVKYKKIIPNNFRLTASKGGKEDYLIVKHKLKYAEVVYSVNEAKLKKLEIDHNDSHAMEGKESFALLLHGVQPKGTIAAKANYKMKKMGVNGYYNKPASVRFVKKKILVKVLEIKKSVGGTKKKVAFKVKTNRIKV